MKAKSPSHCGQITKPYAKIYKAGRITHSIEHGFRCAVCNTPRIPFESNISEFWAAYEKQLDDLRNSSMVFFNEN